jgi:hypothetical protein
VTESAAMTDPLRELLRELLEVWINGRKIHEGMPLPLRERIDAALAQPKLTDIDDCVAELEKDPDMRERIAAARAWIRPALAQQPEPKRDPENITSAYEKEPWLRSGTCVHCGLQWMPAIPSTKAVLYASDPSAAALISEKDAEIARLRAVIDRDHATLMRVLGEKEAAERAQALREAADWVERHETALSPYYARELRRMASEHERSK